MTVRELIARIFMLDTTDTERLDKLETESRFLSIVSQELQEGEEVEVDHR